MTDAIEDAYEALYDDHQRLISALTPSGDTKAAYMGEVKDADFRNRPVSWTAIKAVMAMVRKEGGL